VTEAQIDKAVEFVGRSMLEAGVDLRDSLAVARWMVQNPLPTRAEYEAQMTIWETQDRESKITQLENELELLKAARTQ